MYSMRSVPGKMLLQRAAMVIKYARKIYAKKKKQKEYSQTTLERHEQYTRMCNNVT